MDKLQRFAEASLENSLEYKCKKPNIDFKYGKIKNKKPLDGSEIISASHMLLSFQNNKTPKENDFSN